MTPSASLDLKRTVRLLPLVQSEYLNLKGADLTTIFFRRSVSHTVGYRADIGIEDSERATEKGARRYNDVLMEKVEGLGSKLFHFHVDDVRPSDWREHRTLGTGLVDWTRLLRFLTQTGRRHVRHRTGGGSSHRPTRRLQGLLRKGTSPGESFIVSGSSAADNCSRPCRGFNHIRIPFRESNLQVTRGHGSVGVL